MSTEQGRPKAAKLFGYTGYKISSEGNRPIAGIRIRAEQAKLAHRCRVTTDSARLLLIVGAVGLAAALLSSCGGEGDDARAKAEKAIEQAARRDGTVKSVRCEDRQGTEGYRCRIEVESHGCTKRMEAVVRAISDDEDEVEGAYFNRHVSRCSRVIQPKGPNTNATPSTPGTGGFIGAPARAVRSELANYRISRRACRILGPAHIAYENHEAGTVEEIARKWAQRTATEPRFRKAAFDGCLAGFRSR